MEEVPMIHVCESGQKECGRSLKFRRRSFFEYETLFWDMLVKEEGNVWPFHA